LKSVEGEINISENQILLKKLSLTRNQEPSLVTGVINYTLDIKQRKFNLVNFTIQAGVSDPGVWVFSFLKNILDVETGKVYGSIEAKGDLQGTNLSGRVRVSDAKILIVATKSKLEKVNAELLFDRERIILSKLSGQSGSGTVTAQGWVELHNFRSVKALEYNINVQDAPINPKKDIYGIVSGKLKISWGENTPTSFDADITVKEALLTIGFGQEVQSGPPANLVYNITVKGDRGIWLRNSISDIELSIDLNIRKTLTESFYSGILKTRQGNFYYLDHNLNVTEGEITFDNVNELNPDLNLNAEMYTRAMKVNSEKLERVKIKLQLTGTLQKPVFNFYSDPSVLSQDDIISYLTLNVTPQEISAAEQREIFNKLISERLLGYFERQVAKRVRDFIRLDYLMFETGLFDGGNGAKVTVGKYIAKNLYTTYTHNISGLTQDVFKVEYYITKSHEMIGEKDEQGRYRIKYQFKLRY
jgi:autotransporter translocation and assembly factor TamB